MKVHFISIGGSVMHQLAIALKRKGYQVTGTDDEIFEPALGNLAAEGLLPAAMGWQPDLISPDLDAVILGMHARIDNPELVKARELGLKIYSFPEYIYHESRQKQRIVVGGSHGKTTTTSMIMHVLKTLGRDFDYLVGARLNGFDQSVKITDSPLIVCEGDEYPASAIERKPKFHFLFPHVAILTGIAWDHINVFPTFEIYLEQFRIFIGKIEAGGLLIYNETDPVLAALVDECRREDLRYQPYGVPEHTISNGATTVTLDGVSGSLQVFGNHNLMNLNAAFYACRETGIAAADFIPAIGSFAGASKRLELLAANNDTNVYRDFAHAPSKVKATIEAVKKQYPERRLIALLELHTYSSLNADFMEQYQHVMDEADEAAVFYSKHALEIKKMPELAADKVVTGFAKPGLEVITDRDTLQDWLEARNYRQSNLLLMSSGNYDGLDMLTFAKKITQTST
ncbi:UDP-N-acetylmuramate--L-alanine ligase [Sediminibacterium ginsengisoli]|uniref:UDP-N-acetylmuramate: L-alanyl-gamma-D-glutamyl-meso-diaminopimelate ligase n=1 Tax=Sediminibacterium ginsengisoli TaxID=413434 RepID=A0A1T4RX06_9BACT|nr:Mur ligase family protein [Sediminibacterium ginsengisoli]SKA20510.1 UDP-N-acetylmuramate: L-alanyl-gamma-D-glutamyl-meso-diaminopimelate ligase [Sediminibacterium ginsengisoli]